MVTTKQLNFKNKTYYFYNNLISIEDFDPKLPQSYNYFHNILRLFDVLPNFPFTTSETMGDYYL